MPKINLLPKSVAELIAAGEVVERPASVIKEIIENSIDASATSITVEIARGGISYIRVTDNGCGIDYNDVPTAFLRHATSKIKEQNDLDAISTLGFRGEALAAISSVAKVEMLTATKSSEFGAYYVIEGGEQKVYEESGCPKGTTIIIRDIFYNTPARMKFLKKDISEANACAAVVERIALSHPEISFKLIRDGKVTLSTTGDGNVKGTVYSVLGREFASTLIEAKGEINNIKVEGLICKPVACRPTRNNQFTFLNGRLVRSATVVAAVEQAYKNSAMIGKFPGFVLYITLPLGTVDVNVHPAKTEVRFSDEKSVFDSVYVAVKNALELGDTRPKVALNTPAFNRFEHITAQEYRQQVIPTEKSRETIAEQIYKTPPKEYNHDFQKQKFAFNSSQNYSFVDNYSTVGKNDEKVEPKLNVDIEKTEQIPENEIKLPSSENAEEQRNPAIKVIGEAFSTYIIAEMGDSVFMIDKHAAHERILFNKLKSEQAVSVQALLAPVSAVLESKEYDAVINNLDLLNKNGFEVEDFGNSTVLIRAVPTYFKAENLALIISEIAQSLINTGSVSTEKQEHIFHTAACRAAIKAGNKISGLEMQVLAEKVLSSNEIMYCPHGRPVAFEIRKKDLEKQFGRIQ